MAFAFSFWNAIWMKLNETSSVDSNRRCRRFLEGDTNDAATGGLHNDCEIHQDADGRACVARASPWHLPPPTEDHGVGGLPPGRRSPCCHLVREPELGGEGRGSVHPSGAGICDGHHVACVSDLDSPVR